MMNPATPRRSSEIDTHIGGRLRQRRKLVGLSQTDLAEGLGLTFQQVQKYERGANRISAAKLYEAAHILHVEVAYFFEGLDPPQANPDVASAERQMRESVTSLLNTPEGLDVANTVPKIARGATRRQVAALIRTLADNE